jgi:DNA repair exonuclease SbcCD ATPase subunit
MPKYCPKCGARALPGARFCRSCGAKLEKKKKTSSSMQSKTTEEEPVTPSEPEAPKEPERPKPSKKEVKKVKLTQDEEESLLIISSIIPLQKKIEELNKEKDSLEIKFRVEEELSEKEYDKEIKGVSKKIQELQEDIDEKQQALKNVALLKLVEEVVEMRERQDKLEEIYKEGRIQESTYESLKNEYKGKEKALQAKVDSEEERLEQYRAYLEDEKDQASSLKEELFARHSVGEITEDEYRERLDELEKRNIDGLIAAIDEVLDRMAGV